MHVRAGKAEGHARSGYRVQSPSPRRGQERGALARLEDGRRGQRGAVGAGARPPVCPCQAWLASPGREQTRGIRTWPVSSGLAPRHRGDGTTGHLRARGDPPPVRLWEGRLTSQLVLLPHDREPGPRPRPEFGRHHRSRRRQLQGRWPGQPRPRVPAATLTRSCRWGRAQPQSWLCAERLAPPPSASPRVRASQDSRSLTSGPPPPHPTETRCRCGQGHLETSPP